MATQLRVDGDWIDFQDYFVRRRHSAPVEALRYQGAEDTAMTPEVERSLAEAEAIVLVNSNPALSILPILAVPGINDLVAGSGAPRVAVSPIVGTAAVTGPAGDLMTVLGYPASARGVAQVYLGLIDGIVIDRQDENQSDAIEALGPKVLVTETVMKTLEDRERLAVQTLEFARGLR
jgi:LPPG:FO 2-phospho-L-lactate transferase